MNLQQGCVFTFEQVVNIMKRLPYWCQDGSTGNPLAFWYGKVSRLEKRNKLDIKLNHPNLGFSTRAIFQPQTREHTLIIKQHCLLSVTRGNTLCMALARV